MWEPFLIQSVDEAQLIMYLIEKLPLDVGHQMLKRVQYEQWSYQYMVHHLTCNARAIVPIQVHWEKWRALQIVAPTSQAYESWWMNWLRLLKRVMLRWKCSLIPF